MGKIQKEINKKPVDNRQVFFYQNGLEINRDVYKRQGAYGMVVLDREHPEHLVAARSGSPLVIGLGIGENFLASDPVSYTHLVIITSIPFAIRAGYLPFVVG